MRVIGNIEHPTLKITVFKTDNKISVKFENEGYEQTFKLGQHEQLNNIENVRKWVDQQLLEDISLQMTQIHQSRLAAEARAFPAVSDTEFEDII